MKIAIKRQDPKDPQAWRTIKALQRSCLPDDDIYEPSNASWWVAYDGEQPVAFCAATPSTRWTDTVYLARAGVIRSHRGRGIQRQLIRKRLSWARRAGYNWAISDTTENVPSANNLIACGFKLYDPSWPYAYKHTLYWKYALQRRRKAQSQAA